LNGGFSGLYCALSVAALTNLLTPELTINCADFIKRAQTYEGGIGPYPNKEAHNGYTYCGIAAMQILGTIDQLDMDALLVSHAISWLVRIDS
jgi:protein farnesyltransferase subunit beta